MTSAGPSLQLPCHDYVCVEIEWVREEGLATLTVCVCVCGGRGGGGVVVVQLEQCHILPTHTVHIEQCPH